MMNFLPEEDKRMIKREYWRRFAVVFGLFLFLAALIGIALLVPVFLFLKGEKESWERQLAVSEERISRSGIEDIVPLVDDLNEKISLLAAGQGSSWKESETIKNILERKTKGIKIKNFSSGKDTFSLEGTSDTRDDFLAFVDSLKNSNFKDVESPVSNLIEEKNINFTINISL